MKSQSFIRTILDACSNSNFDIKQLMIGENSPILNNFGLEDMDIRFLSQTSLSAAAALKPFDLLDFKKIFFQDINEKAKLFADEFIDKNFDLNKIKKNTDINLIFPLSNLNANFKFNLKKNASDIIPFLIACSIQMKISSHGEKIIQTERNLSAIADKLFNIFPKRIAKEFEARYVGTNEKFENLKEKVCEFINEINPTALTKLDNFNNAILLIHQFSTITDDKTDPIKNAYSFLPYGEYDLFPEKTKLDKSLQDALNDLNIPVLNEENEIISEDNFFNRNLYTILCYVDEMFTKDFINDKFENISESEKECIRTYALLALIADRFENDPEQEQIILYPLIDKIQDFRSKTFGCTKQIKMQDGRVSDEYLETGVSLAQEILFENEVHQIIVPFNANGSMADLSTEKFFSYFHNDNNKYDASKRLRRPHNDEPIYLSGKVENPEEDYSLFVELSEEEKQTIKDKAVINSRELTEEEKKNKIIKKRLSALKKIIEKISDKSPKAKDKKLTEQRAGNTSTRKIKNAENIMEISDTLFAKLNRLQTSLVRYSLEEELSLVRDQIKFLEDFKEKEVKVPMPKTVMLAVENLQKINEESKNVKYSSIANGLIKSATEEINLFKAFKIYTKNNNLPKSLEEYYRYLASLQQKNLEENIAVESEIKTDNQNSEETITL